MRHHLHARPIFVFGFIATLIGFAFFAVVPAEALTIVPACARGNELNPPSLRCALTTFTNVASLIVGVTGSFALLMFVYGGFMMLTSGGVEARVTLGKTILKNAIIGILLVFTAGYIIDYAVRTLNSGTLAVTIGETKCNDGLGTYQRDPRRGTVCQTVCTVKGLKDQGYQCINPAPTTPGGPAAASNCNIDYTGCTSPQECCIPNPETPAEPAPTEGGF